MRLLISLASQGGSHVGFDFQGPSLAGFALQDPQLGVKLRKISGSEAYLSFDSPSSYSGLPQATGGICTIVTSLTASESPLRCRFRGASGTQSRPRSIILTRTGSKRASTSTSTGNKPEVSVH